MLQQTQTSLENFPPFILSQASVNLQKFSEMYNGNVETGVYCIVFTVLIVLLNPIKTTLKLHC